MVRSSYMFEFIVFVVTKHFGTMFSPCEVFLGLFRQYKRNGRVLLPLLSTLDKLLSHGCLDELVCAKDGTFITKLMSCLTSESNGCGDVKRLLAIVGVSLNLLQPNLEAPSIVRELSFCSIVFLHIDHHNVSSSFILCTDARGNHPIHHDHASKSLPKSETLHCGTALRQTCRRWGHVGF